MASRKSANHASLCANTKPQSCAHMLCKLCCVQAMCTWVLCKLCESCAYKLCAHACLLVCKLCCTLVQANFLLPPAGCSKHFWISCKAAQSHGPGQGMLQAEQGRGWARCKPPRARRQLVRQWWGPTLRRPTVALAWTETVAWWLSELAPLHHVHEQKKGRATKV